MDWINLAWDRGEWNCLSVLETSSINFWKPEPIFITFGAHRTATEPITAKHFIYSSHKPVNVCLSLLSLLGNGYVNTFPRQRIQATIESCLTHLSFFLSCLIKGRGHTVAYKPKRSRFRVPMRSLHFFHSLPNPSNYTGPGVYSATNRY
jgi:hypothetical protein